MDSIRGFLRPGLWFYFLLCVLPVTSSVEAATRKNVTIPSAQSVAMSAASGAPVKSGSTLSIPGATQGEYIPYEPGNRKLPIKVLPTINYSIPRIINQAKSLLKNNLGQVVLGATIAAAVSGVGWLIEDGSQPVIKKPVLSPDPPNTSYYYWKFQTYPVKSNPESLCQSIVLQLQTMYPSDGIVYKGLSVSSDTVVYCKHRSAHQSSDQLSRMDRYGSSCKSGSTYDPVSKGCYSTSYVPVSDSDLDMLDPWMGGQSSAWIRDLLRDACSGSIAPLRCFEDLKDNASLSGPVNLTGPSTSTSSTYVKPDGTVGTRDSTTTTNYKVTYGPTYFDFSKTQTTVWNEDGQQVGEETVTESDDIEAEEPADKPSEEPAPCLADCDGPVYEDLYEPTDKTKEDHLDSYSDRVGSIPIISAVGSLFDVSVSAGACPSWSYNSTLDLGIASMPIDLNFDFHCLPWFVGLGSWIQAIFLLGCTLGAIRIGIL